MAPKHKHDNSMTSRLLKSYTVYLQKLDLRLLQRNMAFFFKCLESESYVRCSDMDFTCAQSRGTMSNWSLISGKSKIKIYKQNSLIIQ